MFKVAIVGRANVGKTTLFNRMVGKKIAIVHDIPGITRDRKDAHIDFFGLKIRLSDTAGIENLETSMRTGSTLTKKMTMQSLNAIHEADVCLFIVDGLSGITSQDRAVCDILRKQKKTAVLLVNKSENQNKTVLEQDMFLLGGNMEMMLISAEHNMGLDVIYEFLHRHYLNYLSQHVDLQDESADGVKEECISLAIVGRPNAGKSTLINKILGYDRLITDPVAGTTRDAIAIPFSYKDTKFKLVDTAGIRRKSSVHDVVEKSFVSESLHAIDFAHVVILMIDINTPFDHQDQVIISRITEMGRTAIIAFNKTDTVEPSSMGKLLQHLKKAMAKEMPDAYGGDFFTLSALYDRDMSTLLDEVLSRYHKWRSKISTSKLNSWLRDALNNGAPCPKIAGKKLKVKFIAQVMSSPPSFALFVNLLDIPDSYTQFIRKSIAERFGLQGIPVRLIYKKSHNPFLKKNATINSKTLLRRRHNK